MSLELDVNLVHAFIVLLSGCSVHFFRSFGIFSNYATAVAASSPNLMQTLLNM